jgi:YbgC/YbaW family acyl-CoA thioester hydrolase
VLFHETDMAGIVHFSVYFTYVEEAEHALWRAAGLSIAVPGDQIGWPRVHASLDFHSALRFENEFEVVIRVAAITNKTIRYDVGLTRGDTPVATGTMTIACVRKAAGQPLRAVAIPPDVARRFRVVSSA